MVGWQRHVATVPKTATGLEAPSGRAAGTPSRPEPIAGGFVLNRLKRQKQHARKAGASPLCPPTDTIHIRDATSHGPSNTSKETKQMTRNHLSLAPRLNTTALVARFLRALLTTWLGAVRSAGLKITRHALHGELACLLPPRRTALNVELTALHIFTNFQPPQLLPEYVMRMQTVISATQCCRARARPAEPSQGHVPGERPRHGQLARVPGPSARDVPRQLASNDDHAKNDRAGLLRAPRPRDGPELNREPLPASPPPRPWKHLTLPVT